MQTGTTEREEILRLLNFETNKMNMAFVVGDQDAGNLALRAAQNYQRKLQMLDAWFAVIPSDIEAAHV